MDIGFLSANELAQKIKNKELSCVELLEHYSARVDKYNEDLNAIVVDLREEALDEAQRQDAMISKGKNLGPLHGVPMTIKESYNLAGTPTTFGNPLLKSNVTTTDAESVKKLKAAGANIFGKTNVPLALADFQSYNDIYGTTNNPYALDRIPGGSSGGSAAALAAGLTGLETGSDIGGSIRNPAHFCGVFGHKPTYDLLWAKGHSPIEDNRAFSDISVIGPLARSAVDLDTSIRIVAGPDRIRARGYKLELPDWKGRKLSELKVAVWKNDPLAPVTKETQLRVEMISAALKDEGASVNEDARPSFEPELSHEVYRRLLHSTMSARMPDQEYESLQKYVALLDPEDQSEASNTMRAQVSNFKEWAAANEMRHRLRWQWNDFFEEYDLLLTPTMPTPAFEHDHRKFSERTLMVDNEERDYFEGVFWAGLSGVAYLPSTIVPTGLNAEGLPIGVQMIGPEYSDLVTIGVAGELEQMGFKFEPPKNYL
tara:strand:+ start:860 stop:2311 length:1452 start_codon:yes stop_codon:yes gene_type:complete